MSDDLLTDVQKLHQANVALAPLWLKLMARRCGLFVVASLIGLIGLTTGNFALYLALLPDIGPLWAAAALTLADFIAAGVLFLLAFSPALSSDVDAAVRARQEALEAVETDGQQLRTAIDGLRQEVRDIRDTVAAFVNNPLETATQKLLIPAAMSVLNGLRADTKQDPVNAGVASPPAP